MRAWLCTGAVIAGFLVTGAAPAHADDNAPAHAGDAAGPPRAGCRAYLLGDRLPRAAPAESARFTGGRPLLGGLGGMPPANLRGAPGLPTGGTPLVKRRFSADSRPIAGVDADYR